MFNVLIITRLAIGQTCFHEKLASGNTGTTTMREKIHVYGCFIDKLVEYRLGKVLLTLNYNGFTVEFTDSVA